MPATRNDVAKLAGVSTATVSYVVNNGPRRVSAATQKRVLHAIEQLGYQPSAIARSLKTKRTHTVGVIVADILNYILAEFAKSAEDLLLPRDFSLTVCTSDESTARERLWLDMLYSRRVDGVLLWPTDSANLRLVHSMLDSGIKIVLLGRQVEGLSVDSVRMDNETGAYTGVQHLIQLGHTRIGLLNLPSGQTPGRERLRGYMRAFQDAGLMVDPRFIKEATFKAEQAYSVTGELLDLNPPPTALFVASNRLALGTLQQAKQRSVRVPEDLALCAFDDVPWFSYMTPSISAISYDVPTLAAKAVGFLCERIDGHYAGEPRTFELPCHLEARESTLGVQAKPGPHS